MGGSPCFPCSPVSEHRCGGSGERAQPRPRFLSTCSFLQRTMTGRPASQVTVAEHAENPFPSRRGGKNIPTQGCTAAAVKSLSPAAAKLPESSSGCAPALSQGRGEKQLCAGLFTYFTANNTDLRESQQGCALFWAPSYCFHHAKELFWCRILQVILLQCFGSWDEGDISFD